MKGSICVVVAVMLLLAGCAGPRGTTAEGTTTTATEAVGQTTATTTSKTTASLSDEEAKNRALETEYDRILSEFENSENYSEVSVDAYGSSATIVRRNETGVTVDVRVPYSYSYDCSDGSTGFADLVAETAYLVSDSDPEIMNRTVGIKRACGG
jgi:thiamine biosynthesis lipoprotein ApbE